MESQVFDNRGISVRGGGPTDRMLKEAMKQPIDIKSLAHMFKVTIGVNERRLDAQVKELNNKYVDDWRDNLLSKCCNKKQQVIVTKGMDLWEVWNQGHEIRGAYKCLAYTPDPSPDQLKWWKDTLDQDIETIYSLGRPAIAFGYGILVSAYKNWMIRQKYERVFFDDNITEWYERYQHNFKLFNQEEQLFDLRPYAEKLNSIVANGIRPQK